MNKDNGWIFSANFNRAGNRIAIAGRENTPALWEKSRSFIDMQIAKTLMNSKLEIKLNVQNILAQDLIFYQNNDATPFVPRVSTEDLPPTFFTLFDGISREIKNTVNSTFGNHNNWYNSDTDDARWITKYGRTFSLSLSYNF